MLAYFLRRSLLSVTILWGVITLVFFALRGMPGDPATNIGGPHLTPELRAEIHAEYGLDKPLYRQYLMFMKKLLLHGDLGKSYRDNRPVTEKIVAKIPLTVILTLAAMSIAVLAGVGMGTMSAVYQGRWIDHGLRVLSLLFISLPSFVLAIWISMIFGYLIPKWGSVYFGCSMEDLKFFPVSNFKAGAQGWRFLLLPAVALGTRPLAMILRLTRTSLLETINNDYIRTARAKGLSESVVVVVHALRNSLIPVVTSIGGTFAGLLGGALFIEIIFNWPGIGRLSYDGIMSSDYGIVQGTTLAVGTVFVFVNLLMDFVYAFLDPRISYD